MPIFPLKPSFMPPPQEALLSWQLIPQEAESLPCLSSHSALHAPFLQHLPSGNLDISVSTATKAGSGAGSLCHAQYLFVE